ncbi:glycolate oxidase [Verrucomicrobium sp. GAS474]|uniref:FAD-binding oxidoreductase n=1 Tax=Verrucomicrobium sp. GAS474 TaxID=1882831 RepID=UPI000879EEEE|nr:FAD-linked oxidase C-terminal domain-containing protein [Verrucomicrobium sp. GAS474]SDU07879.1 glycolate oxidase [Verrucomicrobium sp. GAS474]
MKIPARWTNDLAKLLPKGRVALDAATLQAHAGDAWFAARLPEAVVFAQSTAEVSKVLAFASKRGVPVTARGAGRGYVGGCVPQRGGIALSLARMTKVLELNTGDGVARVQPGVITAKLQEAVREKGWFYPPDPASRAESSLGGNVSTNAGGPRCLKYGVTRNYVLGLEVVLADGTVARIGGRTQKNKTGFDLVGLFVGAEGTLGVVTEITLRLIPHPQSKAGFSAMFPTPEAAAAAVQGIFAAGFLPSAMEMADTFTLKSAREHIGADKVPPGAAQILVEIDGRAAGLHGELAEVVAVAQACGAEHLILAEDEAGCERLWEMRRQYSASLKASGLTKLNEDIVVPRSHLVDLFRFAAKLKKQTGMEVACFGHAGDGNIHVNIMLDPKVKDAHKKADKGLDALFKQVLAWGGAITGEHGIGLAKLPWWKEATSKEVREIHRRIKAGLDPKGLLNPGKFV